MIAMLSCDQRNYSIAVPTILYIDSDIKTSLPTSPSSTLKLT